MLLNILFIALVVSVSVALLPAQLILTLITMILISMQTITIEWDIASGPMDVS